MKLTKTLVFILLFSASALLAQAARLTAEFQDGTPSQNGTAFRIMVELSQQVKDGLFIDLPGQSKMVPYEIRLNGNALWMKNDLSEPADNLAVHWDFSDSGLVVRFKAGLLQSGDRIELFCTPHIVDSTSATRRIVLKEMTVSASDITEGQILDSRDFPSLKNK